ncbi:MAG TPA: homoserine dehydrogenase, partial [Tepidisphaeraceae bacterium]|nr:homoserine dehydrogenase [Tepidisphaeraceae bacterium]
MHTGIALIGCGIVGSGVVKILERRRAEFFSRAGVEFDLRHVVVRDPSKARGLPSTIFIHNDVNKAIDDPNVSIVIELIGGTTRAFEIAQRTLKSGKHLITANKSLLASRGPELFALARKHNASIAFEASCGGGIPIIDALLHGLSANRIEALVGIVNGTCNYILTRMTKEELSYSEALKGAQVAGFAEADPTLDVSGRDAAQKLALLGSLAFGAHVKEEDISVEGIDTLDASDISFARELKYVIKLLAIGERVDGNRISLRVHPTLVHQDDVLAEVSGSFNAISVYGDSLGHALFYGRGAGEMPTASAVVSDLLSTAIGVAPLAFAKLNAFTDSSPRASVLPVDHVVSRFYLRLSALDQPGVLARVTEVLGRHGISLAAILQ